MGCNASSSKHNTVPIENSVITLLVSGQNQLLLRKLKLEEDNIDCNQKLNFRGDTLLHYAAIRNNREIIQYLLNLPKIKPHQKNDEQLRPMDMTKNEEIKALFIKKEVPQTKTSEKQRTEDMPMHMNQAKDSESHYEKSPVQIKH